MLLIVAALLTCTNMAFAVSEDIAVPVCSCQNENTDLSVHSDSCARKAYCGTLATNYTAQELFDMWGALPTDVRAFLPTRVSWNDWNKYQELLKLLENFTEEPEQPSEPPLIEEPNSCTCEPQYPYGSTKHDADCIFCFTKLPVEDQFITYTTMTDAQRICRLSTNHTKAYPL